MLQFIHPITESDGDAFELDPVEPHAFGAIPPFVGPMASAAY
jgi:hypothetical protein